MALVTTALLPESAPFTPGQRTWLNGYLAGLMSVERLITTNSQLTPSTRQKSLLILFGSQTGGAEALSIRFAGEAKKRGFAARAVSMADNARIDFSAESHLAIVTSTYGDGDMPDNAQAFWNLLASESAPPLTTVKFSVLALGDANYAKFCNAGKQFDRRLEQLGAKRIYDRVDCDTDYEEKSTVWFEGLMKAIGDDALTSVDVSEAIPGIKTIVKYSKASPFPARLKTNRKLNGEGSAKDTRHIEIILEGSGLSYEVGDALGVVPSNCPGFVSEILGAGGLNGDETIRSPSGMEKPVRQALIEDFELKPFLSEPPLPGISAGELIGKLRKIQPRLYSISSSHRAHPGEVHLTVGTVRYELNGRARKGVCSTFLADRVCDQTLIPVFIHVSPGFRLPPDSDTPVIMVGPGTGVAPFHAFLEERQAVEARGRNWLFYGDQRAATDFLYRDELEAWQKDGLLTHLDVAFSRDQANKIYVQDRMLEKASELWAWLEEGAHFYVCGDATRMARDVDAALHEVCRSAGGMTTEAAAACVGKLKTDKRYCRDVY